MNINQDKRKKIRFVTARNGVIVAAAAATAAASAWERTHRRVAGADLTEAQLRVQRLSDLRYERAMLDEIAQGINAEWGSFAFLGFKGIDEMLAQAGGTIFVVVERGEEGAVARGIVQTILTDVHGDPELLEEAYPSFGELTSLESWKRSRNHGGDTAVLLQITTLGPVDQRGGGLGSLLRNAVLNMLPNSVQYALTTTPVDGTTADQIDVEDTSTYTPAMRFHARGGASPSRLLPSYKTPEDGAVVTAHGEDVVLMRYVRDEEGLWPAKRPPMRIRRVGPLQERVLRTGRILRTRGLRAPHFRAPAIHRPHVSVPHFQGKAVLTGIKAGAARLRDRVRPPEAPISPELPAEAVEP